MNAPTLPRHDHAVRASIVRDVLAERARHVEGEGWTVAHDDGTEAEGQLAGAAACYAFGAPLWTGEPDGPGRLRDAAGVWPWSPGWWKPSDRYRDLVKAMSLCVAEAERILRRAARDRAESDGAEPLTADCTRLLPGAVLDDTTYGSVESALDAKEAPCTEPGTGRWLTLAERLAHLPSMPGEADVVAVPSGAGDNPEAVLWQARKVDEDGKCRPWFEVDVAMVADVVASGYEVRGLVPEARFHYPPGR